ncbi:ABC transporter substrate-binding protein [Synechococcales cyanobacterium C]|uniref:ABC transporter substrate-binding protein n=1 Tax=Petrachloros mirabilis ULC683 TaxID=2781853 RepID=A0A8K2A1B4_9CYAN|nr:ABC transporter substrate-binding protein [Petrachloros mirabilis]NCJ07823.1 ABC transporter substrate-binding protein [Petrachloros mirabilis ULC683]
MSIPRIRQYKVGVWLGAIAALLCACTVSTVADSPDSLAGAERPECVQRFDPEVDYFPDKVKLEEAQGFQVTYHNHYKVVSVQRPWQDATTQFQYVLVQCGTPVPPGFADAQVVTVPVRSVVALSTTHLVPLEQLGVLDTLVGVSDFQTINTPAVIVKIAAQQLTEVSRNAALNMERILALDPELVTTFGTGNPERDAHPKLMEAGLPVAINAEYMESTPLGRAEWLKFMALFFNQEARATNQFNGIAQQYRDLAQRVESVTHRPTVFVGFARNGTWHVPGGDSYVAQFLADAGADYLWSDDPSAGSRPLSFEQVYARAAQATYWLNGDQRWLTQADVVAADPRYGDFLAWQLGNLYSPIARVNEHGGNDYWESGTANPHWVLADLVKIFHPEQLPNHDWVYYQKLP